MTESVDVVRWVLQSPAGLAVALILLSLLLSGVWLLVDLAVDIVKDRYWRWRFARDVHQQERVHIAAANKRRQELNAVVSFYDWRR